MRRIQLLFISGLLYTTSVAQSFHLGLFGGVSVYSGDLNEKLFPKKQMHPVVGITGNYELTEKIMIRGGFNYTTLEGADRYSEDPHLVSRNLSFESKLWEVNLLGEYHVLNLNDRRYTPYAFAGFAIYHFNPYAYHANGQKVFLKPLSTEGQGLPGYADRKEYSLTQLAIPFGGGLKFAISENLRIGLEVGVRRLFTDYLDDVSTSFADAADLLAARGQLAVDMSYRSDEVGGDPAYPQKNSQRGGAAHDDYYYFTGLHLTYKLGSGGFFGGGGGGKSKTGCPVNVY